MANNLTFRGAKIRSLEGVYAPAAHVLLHLTSDISEPIMEQMEWEDLPECFIGGHPLKGSLLGNKLILTPNDKLLRDHEIEIECSEIMDFRLERIKSKDGESFHDELRFTAKSISQDAAGLLDSFGRIVGKSQFSLKANYTQRSEKQGKLKLEKTEEEKAAEAKPNGKVSGAVASKSQMKRTEAQA